MYMYIYIHTVKSRWAYVLYCGNTKNPANEKFVAFRVQLLYSLAAMRSGVCTHYNDDFVGFQSTLCANICRDGGVICQCLLDSFDCNHAEPAQERDVCRL